MADSAAQVRYRAEFIAAFEMRETLVRKTVTTEADIRAASAVFAVAGSGNASAVTRGSNGLIPARAQDLNQYTATLTQWHDLTRRDSFNIYTSQGDARKSMQMEAIGVLNRKIDDNIITELNTATQDTGAAATASLNMVMHAYTILGNANVPLDGNVSALITPAFHAYLMQTKEFTSVDYINNKPFEGKPMAYRWAGINFIVHPTLPGKATSAEKCFMYHRDAIGHACNMSSVDVVVDYNKEQDYSYARATGYMGSKILQNSGIVVMNHNGAGYVVQ